MKIFIYALAILAFILSVFSSVNAEEWPGKEKGLGAPTNLYPVGKSCGDFVRAENEYKQNQPNEYRIFSYWVSGYITALNSELPKGGNVLGSTSAKIDDFILMVSSYCSKNPLEPFINGVSTQLKRLKPVDWQNREYKY